MLHSAGALCDSSFKSHMDSAPSDELGVAGAHAQVYIHIRQFARAVHVHVSVHVIGGCLWVCVQCASPCGLLKFIIDK